MTGQQIAATIGITLAIVLAVAVPLLTLRRLRTPEQRRDAWLSANAQPRLALAGHVLTIVASVVGGLIGLLFAVVGGVTIAWAIVAMSVGLTASTIITLVLSSRVPPDLE